RRDKAMLPILEKNGSTCGENSKSPSLPTSAACPLCGVENAPRLFVTRDRIHRIPGEFGIHRCKHCRALFIQPWMKDEQLARYYPEDYGRYRVSGSRKDKALAGWRRFVLEHRYGYPKSDGNRSSAMQRIAAFLLSWFVAKGVMHYRGDGRVLDVGAGGGSYLYQLKQWGWKTYGVEPSAMGARQGRRLGLTVHQGTLAEARLPNSFFDVVRLENVLEHLPDPIAVFEEINRILKPDGLVYITVPNTRSFVYWLFGENWYALDSPRHVICYCPATLMTLCDRTGFEIAGMHFTAGPFNFVRSLKYYFETKGRFSPQWLRRIPWERSKLIRRALKPFFFFIDASGYGDCLHATLRKKPNSVITGVKLFEKPRNAGQAVNLPARVHQNCNSPFR
ncbi:MAG: methyltransferase domain-containing protein, partial [Deltaproteobacteria bacterium]|nr:methyltransferase domain-containing protein [Deltaproteobacteria bacterium]